MKQATKSAIWRVVSEKIGHLEGFSSERDMESFLMNNPVVIGCDLTEAQGEQPLVRAQVVAKSEKGDWGRMDIVGLARNEEGGLELRVFELKLGEIDVSAVKQLASYLENWQHELGPRKQIRTWALSLGIQDIDESTIDGIIGRPVGVLVGPRFKAEAIKAALELKQQIQGLRLARFRGTSRSEYYVIAEDQIGTPSGRRYWSWHELIEAGLITKDDSFSLTYNDVKLSAKPDPKFLKHNWIRLIYDQPSIEALLAKEQQIRDKLANHHDAFAKRWVPKALDAMKAGKSIVITNATGLCYFAFGGPTSYWVPADWWVHEKSKKSLAQLKEELYRKKG